MAKDEVLVITVRNKEVAKDILMLVNSFDIEINGISVNGLVVRNAYEDIGKPNEWDVDVMDQDENAHTFTLGDGVIQVEVDY